MNEELEVMNSGEGVGGALSTATDLVSDFITGIPAPIRKNALMAFSRLCTAAVEYPVTLIESAIAERRAESQARVKLINNSAIQIADQLKINPEYVYAASNKFAQKIVREQVNVDLVTQIAAADLKSEPHSIEGNETEAPPISEDWLNVFEGEAAKMSSEEMQRLFGKILAGEIRRPASYSIKTIKLMAQLDNEAANLFRRLCSLSISMGPGISDIIDARVVSMGRATANSLDAYGLGFAALNILEEYGLITSNYESYADYQYSIVHENRITLPIFYENTKWTFVQKIASPTRPELKLFGVTFTRSGQEIRPLVDIAPNEQYTEALKNFFDQQGMMLTKYEDDADADADADLAQTAENVDTQI
jgi:hypothetical protein